MTAWSLRPRHGKPVEINAAWFPAFQLVADMIDADRPNSLAVPADRPARAGQSPRESFWNAGAGCLYDVLTPGPGGWTQLPDRGRIRSLPAASRIPPWINSRPNRCFPRRDAEAS